MAYTKTTWVDEVLESGERFDILPNGGGTPLYEDVQIILSTNVTTTGTTIDAAVMQNIEDGIEDLATGAGLSVKGVTGSSAGDVEDIVAGTDNYVLRRSGSALAFGLVPNASLVDHKELVYLSPFWYDEDIESGNGKMYFTVPPYLAGTIVDFDISVITPSSSGLVTVQMANCGANPAAAGTDILSTPATIDAGEWSSMTAASQPVIGSGSVASGNVLRVDVDGIGTGVQGLNVFFVIEKS